MMKLTILFWKFNIDKGKLMNSEPSHAAKAAVLARVARANGVDVLVVCESATLEPLCLVTLT
jgi:hypothetical protein